jgi:hypothetical protein
VFGRPKPAKALAALVPSDIEAIRAAEFQLIAAPWKKTIIFVTVRKLSATQIMACGNFSLIETEEYQREKARPTNWKRYCEYAEQTAKICRASLVSPTYAQIFEVIGKKAFNEEARARFIEIKKEISEMQRGPARQELEKQNEATRVLWEFLLPEDFVSAIVTYALDSENEVIKSLTDDILLELAILAEKGHDNPSDHLDGKLSAFNKIDIDRCAMYALYKYREENKHGSKKGPPARVA